MKVIDARSGEELAPGAHVTYPGGDWLKLVEVEPGIFHAKAVIDHGQPNGMVRRSTIPLIVRWMHPGFLFQHVGFIPS